MTVTRPKLSPDTATTSRLAKAARNLDSAKIELKAAVIEAKAGGASFHEISRITGVSTNSLQSWVRQGSDE